MPTKPFSDLAHKSGVRTRTVKGPFKMRRNARKEERRLTQMFSGLVVGSRDHNFLLTQEGIPAWARGFRVEKAGFFQYTVVATERTGH